MCCLRSVRCLYVCLCVGFYELLMLCSVLFQESGCVCTYGLCVCVCVCVCVFLCKRESMCACTCVYVLLFVHVCVCVDKLLLVPIV